ncbi:hypothetical protein [Aureliella helgolandensis]|uniref:Heparin and heparin-sulfate lyase n=1 Tax=Aureliella helgolandensis TaxID=2527968 RepID=A0A518GDV8_9BACT|nr:hypothetical protein [Aureliella helgolandensis]QDV26782.1 Heparin and heparin-sulfate lyase precursor [Aureliella helgolandensis]
MVSLKHQEIILLRWLTSIFIALWSLCLLSAADACAADAYTVHSSHPRILLNSASVKELAKHCQGPLKAEYAELKSNADRAVSTGQIKFIDNKWATPTDLMACGMCYLVERELGNPHADKYAVPIVQCWGDGSRITNKGHSAFGYHALVYDWIYDALSEEERKTFGNALGQWLTWYTHKPEITLIGGHWEYNQTWGVSHMNVMHARDAIVQKLFISLAITGASTSYEADAKRFLDSWNTRIPRDCIPAFDAMGGSWAESHGHGSYGPISIVPWAFEAWRTATGKDWFQLGNDSTFLKEMSRWLTYLTVPHTGRHAYIDDGGGSQHSSFDSSAPIIAKVYNDPLAQAATHQAFTEGSYRYGSVWQRLLMDPEIGTQTPGEMQLPLGYLFKGAGHVFMQSHWDDPNATWAFFGAGPHIAGHQHDDEGHFLISRQGGLVGKGGGKGTGNDSDHYWGGSLCFNILTIYDPDESMRRHNENENDGGLRRLVYNNDKVERGNIAAFQHHPAFTYAAANLTQAYNSSKVREVTRQFIYLRNPQLGGDEYFVVFDRVHSTKAAYAKHFVLHMPEEPQFEGDSIETIAGHVYEHKGAGLISTWLSLPQDMGDEIPALSSGKSRMFLKTVLPQEASITKRGGAGHKNWGHPLNPNAQYDHHNEGRERGPVANWRLEVAAPLAERSYFLHVFQVSQEGTQEMSSVELLRESDTVGVSIGQQWEISFNKAGTLGGSIKTDNGEAVNFSESVEVAEQYRQWNVALQGETPSS